jgi:hypothetical protein
MEFFVGIYLSFVAKFLKTKTIDLKDKILPNNCWCSFMKNLHVVDVIELAIEHDFCLHKVAASWWPLP